MIPPKLGKGNEIRVISPSDSLSTISDDVVSIAKAKLESLGLTVSFGEHARELSVMSTSGIESRISDLNDAFSDKNVKAILTSIGGNNCNQLLKYIDYDLIKANPKILCGFSDITALSNAIYAKTGLVGYNGPHFSTFGMEKGIDYTVDYFKSCFFGNGEIKVQPSKQWSEDAWYLDQEHREFKENDGFVAINEGETTGIAIGGEISTLNLLNGTEFMPNLEGKIIFLESDESAQLRQVDRMLQALLHQPAIDSIAGLLIGRFPSESEISDSGLKEMIKSKKELKDIPVLANVDFGHTTPSVTLPIGGKIKFKAYPEGSEFVILEH